MFGISFEELIVLLVLALILFGPEKLPEYAEKLGRLVAKLRQASSDVSRSLQTIQYPDPPSSKPAALCPQCGQTLTQDFAFCPHCGQSRRPAPEADKTLAS